MTKREGRQEFRRSEGRRDQELNVAPPGQNDSRVVEQMPENAQMREAQHMRAGRSDAGNGGESAGAVTAGRPTRPGGCPGTKRTNVVWVCSGRGCTVDQRRKVNISSGCQQETGPGPELCTTRAGR